MIRQTIRIAFYVCVALGLLAHSRSCLQPEQVAFDSGDSDYRRTNLTMFVRRVCGRSGDYGEIHWKALASDGTVLSNGYTNWEVMYADIGNRAEWRENVPVDARITKLVVWAAD